MLRYGEMTKTEKLANLGAVVLPFLATIAAIVLLWNRFVSAPDLVIAAVMYLLTAIGITVGFHRLLTHRSFQTSKPLEYTFAVLGSMAVQGPVISWVADHRKHHAHTDEEGDPHSPHVGHDGGVRGVFSGLWHAHSGWLMSTQGRADWKHYAADLYEDRGMRLISRQFVPLVCSAWRCPPLAGYIVERHPRRRRHRPALGWIGPNLLRPPRDLERQLGMPLSRHPPVRHRRSLDQCLLARAALAGRVLAPQPPRLPRSAVHGLRLGARPLRFDHRRAGEAGPGPERGPHLT